MIETIKEIKQRFTAIHQQLDQLLSSPQPWEASLLQTLTEDVGDAYVRLNDGMLEEFTLCQECAANRDQIKKMVQLLEDLDPGATLSAGQLNELRRFGSILDAIDGRISEVLKIEGQ